MGFLNRFHGGRDIRFILKKGVRSDSASVSLRRYKSNKSRTAVIVSKKVHKHAVVRNKIRRRIMEIINEQRNSSISTDDFVFVVKDAEVSEMPFERLKKQLLHLINQ